MRLHAGKMRRRHEYRCLGLRSSGGGRVDRQCFPASGSSSQLCLRLARPARVPGIKTGCMHCIALHAFFAPSCKAQLMITYSGPGVATVQGRPPSHTFEPEQSNQCTSYILLLYQMHTRCRQVAKLQLRYAHDRRPHTQHRAPLRGSPSEIRESIVILTLEFVCVRLPALGLLIILVEVPRVCRSFEMWDDGPFYPAMVQHVPVDVPKPRM